MKKWNILLVYVALMLLGCVTSFNYNYSKIEIGSSKQKVISNLGIPDSKKEDSMIGGVFWGPQEVLVPTLKPGELYSEWQYERNNIIYYIWFSGSQTASKDTWKVIEKSSYSKGTVFESEH